jgi:hypothetical protein
LTAVRTSPSDPSQRGLLGFPREPARPRWLRTRRSRCSRAVAEGDPDGCLSAGLDLDARAEPRASSCAMSLRLQTDLSAGDACSRFSPVPYRWQEPARQAVRLIRQDVDEDAPTRPSDRVRRLGVCVYNEWRQHAHRTPDEDARTFGLGASNSALDEDEQRATSVDRVSRVPSPRRPGTRPTRCIDPVSGSDASAPQSSSTSGLATVA